MTGHRMLKQQGALSPEFSRPLVILLVNARTYLYYPVKKYFTFHLTKIQYNSYSFCYCLNY